MVEGEVPGANAWRRSAHRDAVPVLVLDTRPVLRAGYHDHEHAVLLVRRVLKGLDIEGLVPHRYSSCPSASARQQTPGENQVFDVNVVWHSAARPKDQAAPAHLP